MHGAKAAIDTCATTEAVYRPTGRIRKELYRRQHSGITAGSTTERLKAAACGQPPLSKRHPAVRLEGLSRSWVDLRSA